MKNEEVKLYPFLIIFTKSIKIIKKKPDPELISNNKWQSTEALQNHLHSCK